MMPIKISRRNYLGAEDQKEMMQLARENQADFMHVTDLPYRFSSWALDDAGNVGLWVDNNGQLVGWAVMQTPFWTVDYAFKPDVHGIHALILKWADRRAKELIQTDFGLPSWYMNVFADQMNRIRDLKRSGFVSQANLGENSWSKVWMEFSESQEVPAYPLPKGFNLRPLAGENEVEAYVALHQATFETKNMTDEWRRRTLRQPDYNPMLDVVVLAPDGRLAAFCIGWISRIKNGSLSGQIEPLGCHADFRSYALGRVVLCETLHRLQHMGAENILVETDNYRNTAFRLYESVGFRMKREVLVYGKDYNDLRC